LHVGLELGDATHWLGGERMRIQHPMFHHRFVDFGASSPKPRNDLDDTLWLCGRRMRARHVFDVAQCRLCVAEARLCRSLLRLVVRWRAPRGHCTDLVDNRVVEDAAAAAVALAEA
jgi:hypothetical protein